MQDLHVTDILPQMITLTEAYIQVKSLTPLFDILRKSFYHLSLLVADLRVEDRLERINLLNS